MMIHFILMWFNSSKISHISVNPSFDYFGKLWYFGRPKFSFVEVSILSGKKWRTIENSLFKDFRGCSLSF